MVSIYNNNNNNNNNNKSTERRGKIKAYNMKKRKTEERTEQESKSDIEIWTEHQE
jgi:hypothetical protein